jgi:hypothetical protein
MRVKFLEKMATQGLWNNWHFNDWSKELRFLPARMPKEHATWESFINSSMEAVPMDIVLQTYSIDIPYDECITVPMNIGRFIHLTQLKLDENTCVSEMPSSLQKLQCLQYLVFTHATKVCQLPSWIGTLTSLQHLDISNNNLVRLPPTLRNLHNLTFFDCSYNGYLPAFIWGFSYGIRKLAKKGEPKHDLKAMSRYLVHHMIRKRYTYGGARAAALATMLYLGRACAELKNVLRWNIAPLLWASREDDAWRHADEVEYQRTTDINEI